MITEVKERLIKVKASSSKSAYEATVRDGVVCELENRVQRSEVGMLAYIAFLKEVLEAIRQTK